MGCTCAKPYVAKTDTGTATLEDLTCAKTSSPIKDTMAQTKTPPPIKDAVTQTETPPPIKDTVTQTKEVTAEKSNDQESSDDWEEIKN